ncbi:MAG: hypothetical protein mread185_000653 [Mycoplasmataceae bacterium]|nr:MAG: hypothetical protein mread185_000653 [Mycoplasmataceae bacterium]
MGTNNNHSPPSKRKLKIAKLEHQLANRLKQKNTDKKEKDVAKLQKRIGNLTTKIPTGKRGRLKDKLSKLTAE